MNMAAYMRRTMSLRNNFEDSPTTKRMRMSEPESYPTSSGSSLDKWKEFLIKYIEPDFGLLDVLLSYEILSEVEFSAIKAKGSAREKNEAIINWISKDKSNRYPMLLDVLKETNQSHLVNYLAPDRLKILAVNSFSAERLVDLQLKEEMTLRVNWEILLELIEGPSDLSQKLHAIGVLSRRQNEYISGQPGDIKRNEVLLGILKRGTIGNYEETICCLRSSEQQHVSDILEGGATARTRCLIVDAIKGIVQRVELQGIVTRLTERLSEEGKIVLELKSFGLRTVKLDKEIIFYFHFKTEEDLKCARNAFDSKEMEASAGRDFKSLQLPNNHLSIVLDWSENDFNRCRKYFYHISSTSIDDLPETLLDMVVCRAYKRVFRQPSEDGVMGLLSTISRCWRIVISRSRLKLARRFYQRIFYRSAIIRNNRRYLTDNMQQPDLLINYLISANCLQHRQATSIAERKRNTDKNWELLDVIKSLPLEKYFLFLECLRLKEQHNIADVIDKGGVTIRVAAKVRMNVDILTDRLKNIHVCKHEVESAIGLHDVDLLEIQLDRGNTIVLWLWCRTKHSLDNLRIMNEDKDLPESISTLLHCLINSDESIVNVDSKEFEKNCVVSRTPVSAEFGGNMLYQYGQSPFGKFAISCLQDKIYAASDSKTIHIYDNNAPYRELEHKINLPQSENVMSNSLELAACQVHKCLYIVDRDENCIWKMIPENDYVLIKWLSPAFMKLSVSSDGKIFLMDDTDRTHPQLRIYTSDAKLESTIPMRGDSYIYYWEAVEFMPGFVAVQYEKHDGLRKKLKGIAIVCLNETGDILRDVQFERILHLAPYSHGRLIAADPDANEVILLDDQLRPLKVILSHEKRGLQWPKCFSYRKDTRQLIVDHFGGGGVIYEIDVYKLSSNDIDRARTRLSVRCAEKV